MKKVESTAELNENANQSASNDENQTDNSTALMSKQDFGNAIAEIQIICNEDRFYRMMELFIDLRERNIRLSLLHAMTLRRQLVQRNNSVNIDEIYELYKKDNS